VVPISVLIPDKIYSVLPVTILLPSQEWNTASSIESIYPASCTAAITLSLIFDPIFIPYNSPAILVKVSNSLATSGIVADISLITEVKLLTEILVLSITPPKLLITSITL
jgi:hypothetical protein